MSGYIQIWYETSSNYRVYETSYETSSNYRVYLFDTKILYLNSLRNVLVNEVHLNNLRDTFLERHSHAFMVTNLLYCRFRIAVGCQTTERDHRGREAI